MRTMTRHIINLCLTACAALAALCGCSDTLSSSSDGNDGKMLVLRIGMIGQTRASENAAIEQMHSLRVIVLDAEGKVEHNAYKPFDTGQAEYTCLIPDILPGTKKIYLIANEESVDYITGAAAGEKQSLHNLLNTFGAGETDVAEQLNALYFEPDYTENIPLSARYDIEIEKDDTEIERTLYLVRVATKFTVRFENLRDEDVTVRNFTISSVAKRSFLMPKLNEDAELFERYPTWIDWLKEVSDKSLANPNNPNVADEDGWLQDYELPEGETSETTYAYNAVPADKEKYITVAGYDKSAGKAGEREVTGIYIPESKHLKEGSGTDGEQEYVMTFDIEGRSNEQNGQPYPLPNLKALFRNTYVLVNVTMKRGNPGDNLLEVKIIGWEDGDSVVGGWEEVNEAINNQ